MRLNDYLRTDLVLMDLEASGPEEVVAAVAGCLESVRAVPDREQVARALMEREKTHSTAMGRGFALPHATIAGIEEPLLVVAVASTPVPFGGGESGPVSVFFALVSPPGREGEHIKLLARICRLVRQEGFVESVADAGDEEAVVETVRRIDEQHV